MAEEIEFENRHLKL